MSTASTIVAAGAEVLSSLIKLAAAQGDTTAATRLRAARDQLANELDDIDAVHDATDAELERQRLADTADIYEKG